MPAIQAGYLDKLEGKDKILETHSASHLLNNIKQCTTVAGSHSQTLLSLSRYPALIIHISMTKKYQYSVPKVLYFYKYRFINIKFESCSVQDLRKKLIKSSWGNINTKNKQKNHLKLKDRNINKTIIFDLFINNKLMTNVGWAHAGHLFSQFINLVDRSLSCKFSHLFKLRGNLYSQDMEADLLVWGEQKYK